ncbi:MAG TPA: polysialyltransferase family glycosyltransferase [Bacteroidales bacterium]|nr:polysialyltransferase family glycosyltransferase [Bacteroidales bacterium]
MKKHFYYFYDLNEVLIDRYPSKIASQIRMHDPNSNFIFIYSENYTNGHPLQIPPDSKFFYIPSLSKKKLNEIIDKYPPKSLTTIALRIPDMWLLTFFNHKNVPTQIIQHGLWSDRLERIPLVPLLLGKFSKFINYLKYTKEICKINSIPLIPTLKELFHFLLKEDITISETKYLNNNMIKAQTVFAFDSSWDNYYTKKYAYKLNQLIYIGNPDLLLLKEKNIKDKENSICYLCQSLVEDGRLSKHIYNSFLKVLKSQVASEKKLYIKLHPRSKMAIYQELKNCKNIVFTNELPICTHYIAHYTGLLATVKHITDNILIWLLPNHHTPEYFKNFGSVVTNSIDDLVLFVKSQECSEMNLNSSSFQKLTQHDLDKFNPIKKISKNIISLSNDK